MQREVFSVDQMNQAFDPEATQTLCVAYDKACGTIADRDRSEFVREVDREARDCLGGSRRTGS